MPAENRDPQLSELVWAQGTDEPPVIHVVIQPGTMTTFFSDRYHGLDVKSGPRSSPM
jgi:hypothetical protein